MSNSFATLWFVALQIPLSMEFSRQEHWNELLLPSFLPSPEDLPNPRIEPTSPVLAGRFFTTEPHGKPQVNGCTSKRDTCEVIERDKKDSNYHMNSEPV